MSQNGQYKPTGYKHVYLDAKGQPVVGRTRMKVRYIAVEYVHNHESPEDIARDHEGLTPSEVHSALAYYADHKEEVDADIQAGIELYEKMRAAAGPSPLRNHPLRKQLAAEGAD